MTLEVEKVKLSELEPGSVIHLSPEQMRELREKYIQPEGVDTAIIMGTHPSFMEGKTALNVSWVKGGKIIEVGSGYTNLRTKSVVEVLKGKEESKIRDTFMWKYKTTYPSPMAHSMMIGGDPEIFALRKDGDVLPAWEFLPQKSSRTAYYWDGLQAEWQAKPKTCLVEYNNGLQININYVAAQARARDKHATLTLRNVVDVPQEVLLKAEQKYLDFGCSPSMNVYDDVGEPPQDPRALPVRFAGGHIHAGIGKTLYTPQIRHAVWALDGILGVACVGMAEQFDDPTRRRFYGRAGEIRLPEHGLEYRVLSNFWLISPAISYLVHEIFRQAIKFGMTGAYSMFFKTPQDEVRRIINTCDVKAARACVKKNASMYSHLVKYMNFGEFERTEKWMFKAIYSGVQSVLPEMDINKNWEYAGVRKILETGQKGYEYIGRAGDLTWNQMSNLLERKLVQPVEA